MHAFSPEGALRRRAATAARGFVSWNAISAGAFFLAALPLTLDTASAQGAPSWQTAPAQPAQKGSNQTAARAKTPTKPADAAPSSGSEASLRQRVEQLEEQLVDLQVVVGTVESLARAGGASSASAAYRSGAPAAPAGGGYGADTGRVAALETQVQALTAQLEQMSQQLRQYQGAAPRGPQGPAPRTSGGFSTTVTTADDPIASILNAPDQRGGAPAPRPGATPAAAPGGRQQYDAAYSQLLQQNYPAAEAGFSEFLGAYPNDELAPNAQFWLGETYFVRGQWDSAAASFLKVAQSYPRSDKAPDSLAKFGMAMERKGNRPAACRAFQELNARYPNPPAHVRSWEQAERRRAGCS